MKSRVPSSPHVLVKDAHIAVRTVDLICFSHLRWHFVTQRPQHLLSRAAKSRRVFYFEEPIWHETSDYPDAAKPEQPWLETLVESDNIIVVRPHLVRSVDSTKAQKALVDELLKKWSITQYDLWYYTPMAMEYTRDLKPSVTLYDCMDELSHFQGAPRDLLTLEGELFSRADAVFTGGLSLFEAKKEQHGSVHAFPSSIDVAHFARAASRSLAEPSDQASVPHPRAGFYGVVDERFDLALLADIARLRPATHFVIVGPVVKIDPETLPQADNIHYLGSKTYNELPSYIAGWDVALLLFARNNATKFISPTKTPEYLAAGKPVVSTPIRDVVRTYGDRGLVQIAGDAAEFVAALDRAYEPPTFAWQQAVRKELAQSSWDRTWSDMEAVMEEARRTKEDHETDRSASCNVAPAVSALRLPVSAAALGKMRSPYKPDHRAETFDYLVVGAGFAGSVMAERLASQAGKRVLVVDRRDHIAGNAYDHYDEHGILVHKYGPHIFHTNSEAVFTYLSRFTTWRPYEHRVLASVDAQLVPIPINLDTINKLYDLQLDSEGMTAFLAARAETPAVLRTSEDIVVSRVGRELYEKFFRNYTRKQWGLDPSQLDAAVAGRIPVRTDRDERYFTDTYQYMPSAGYTRMFERMLDHPRITVRTGVAYQDVVKAYPHAKVVFTGPIDEYYNFCYGPLPYRSLEFRHETHNQAVFQQAPVVNYPNDHAYTRVTEFKYLTGQDHAKTSIVYEYPRAEGDPYYPIPRAENAELYAKYKALADQEEDVLFCGRLANYKYFNMDQVVAQALATYKRHTERLSITSIPLARTAEVVISKQVLEV